MTPKQEGAAMQAAAEIYALRSQLAECFKLAGADPDGNEDWRLAPRAVEAVRELRKDYDDACEWLAAVQAERDACKQEARIHAQEARTANATIAEIYQLCTGGAGEPGNWNGAGPVRSIIAERDALKQRIDSAPIGKSRIGEAALWE